MHTNEFISLFKKYLPIILIIVVVAAIHLIEVNFIDPITTESVGVDYATYIQQIEGDSIYWFSQFWTPALVGFFVIMYIVVYPFTLWFMPFYMVINDEKKAIKTMAYGALLIYLISLPFYLLLPVTNVYTFYGHESALETVIPSIENFFYSTTTQNNCLPSLHTAFTILVAWCAYLTGNKKLFYFTFFSMVSVIIAVIYLAIHWLTDIIAGALLSILVIFILYKYINDV
jgi:membrane-associated phospholipid phosphatase